MVFSFSSMARLLFARPKRTLSRASSRSSCSMYSFPASVAPSADSLMMAARSAPENPGVARARRSRSTFGPSFTLRLCTFNVQPPFDIRQRHINLPIESAGTRQRRIEHVHAIGRGADDHLVVGIEAV